MNSGIYEIKNKINGKRYIGSAINFNRRWSNHISELRNNRHHSIKLQNAYNKYGEDAFEFNILHYVYDVMLIAFEQACLNTYWNEGLYNICPVAGSALGRTFSDESRKKMSDAKKGKKGKDPWNKGLKGVQVAWNKGKTHSEETRKKLSEAKQIISEETRKKMSDAKKGRTSPRKGKTHSEETRKKISESAKNRKYNIKN